MYGLRYGYSGGASVGLVVFAAMSALAATVLAFIFIVPAKKRDNLNKLGKLLHDIVNFRFLIIEKILQALYIFATAFTIFTGFFTMFMFNSYNYGRVFLTSIAIMILGPIAIRIAYEAMMMFILLIKNVIQINNKIKSADESDDPFAVGIDTIKGEPEAEPAPAPVAPAAPVARFCTECGAQKDENGICPNCKK